MDIYNQGNNKLINKSEILFELDLEYDSERKIYFYSYFPESTFPKNIPISKK